MKQVIQEAVNEQIQAEFESAYLYLGMSARMNGLGLKGFAHWLRLQWEEEMQHAMKFYDFVLHRGGNVELKAIRKPEVAFDAPQEAFEQVLAHEQHITQRIHALYDLAVSERDYPLQTLLHWFIDEQVEEEENVKDILENLHLVGGTGPNLFLIDRDLGQRTPDEPA